MSNLNENFKVRKGLTVTTAISAGSCIEGDGFVKHGGTSNQFLKADGSVDSNGYTTCTGTTTHNNTQTFTNKSGSNNQWTNDAGYTTCQGDVTGIDAGTAITVSDGTTATPTVGVTSACNTAWNAKTTCTGTVTGITAGALLSGSASATCPSIGIDSGALDYLNQSACAGIDCTGTTTASNTQTFTNKCGSNSQWINDEGYTTCTGDVEGIDAGTAIAVTDGATSTPTIGVTTACNTAWNAKTTCEGTVTTVTVGPYLTGGGAVTPEIGIDSACAAKWDTAAAGDISEVVAGTNLTGGGSSGCVTINMDTGGIGAGTYGDDATGCKIDTITVDAYGRVTAVACGTTGDIQGITAGNGLSGGGTSGSPTLALDGSCLAGLNQSACPGIDCIGTTTASNTQTFTNKCGSNSQWINDEGYTTCDGTVTSVTRGNGINGTGSITATGSIAVGAGTGITVGTNDVSISAACRNALASAYTTTSNLSGCAGLDCTGTTTASNTQTFTNKSGSNSQWTNDEGFTTCTGTLVASDISGLTCCLGTTTASNSQTFTNKSGSNSQWTNDEGYTTCTGDVTGVTAGAGLSGGGTSGTPTLAVDGVLVATLNQSGCAGLDCTGTTTASNTQTFTNKCGSNSQWINDEGFTTCTGTLVPSGTIATNDYAKYNASGALVGRSCSEVRSDLGINTAANCTAASLDQSSCAGILCTGTTTASNTQTFTNKSGSNSQWTNDEGFTTCTGDITQVAAGDGLQGGATSGCASICVDSTVVRTTGDQTVGGCKVFSDNTTIQGNLSVIGDFTYLDTFVNVTSALSIVNNGTGPALEVNQTGANDIVNFEDDGTSAFYIENGGNVGINDTNPNEKLDVNGNINVTGNIKMDDSTIINSGTCFVGAQVRPTTDIADDYIASAATWNAKTTCTGTLNPAGTIATNDYAKYDASGCLTGRDCSQVRSDLGINSAANCTAASLDQSSCAGILCTGTTTASNTQTFTNKSGDISQWTNDAGYLTVACEGTVTGIDAGTAITITDGATATPTVGVTSACNTAWNAKTTCIGTVVASDISSFTSCTGTTTPSNTQTFTNKSGSNSQWTNDAGYTTCTGDITAITVTNGIAGGGTSGSVALCVDSTVVRTTGAQVIGGTKHFTSTAIVPALSATGTVSANCFAAGAFMEVNASTVDVYPQGTLLALNSNGEVVESTEEESSMVFGVATGDNKAPIVLGAEPICVTGCINVGDFITASSCKGHGRKSTNPYPFGTIIAQAMESGGGDSYEIKAMIRKM